MTLSLLVTLFACKSPSNEPPPPPPPPPPPQPAEQPSRAREAAPPARFDATPSVSATPSAASILAARVLDQKAVAYSAKSRALVWSNSSEFEGFGSAEVLQKIGDEDATDILDYEIGDESEAEGRRKAIVILARLFEEQESVALERTEWSGDEELELAPMPLKLRWKRQTLSISKGDARWKILERYKIDRPHVPGPTAVFWNSEAPVFVTEITYNPGNAYREGYTFRVLMDVFRLPSPTL